MERYILVADAVSSARSWQDLFITGEATPLERGLAAFVAILIIANIVQYIQHQRTQNRHLATAIAVTPIAQKLDATVDKVIEVTESNTRVLERAIDVLEAVRGSAHTRRRAHSPKAQEETPNEVPHTEAGRGDGNDQS